MELHFWIITAAGLLLGCWVQAAMGFGMAIVFAPILVIIRPEWIPFLITFVGFYLCMLNTWSERDAIDMKGILVPLATRVIGTIAGAWVLTQLSIFWIQILVSVTVILSVFVSLISKKFEATPVRLGWAGLFSGLMSTTTSIGGLPMAVVMQHSEPRAARANMSLYFSIGCIMSIASYAVIGRLTLQLFIDSLILLPFVLCGYLLGNRTRKYVDGSFRLITLIICSIGGIIALLGSINSFMN